LEEEQAFDNVDATANLKPWLYPYDPQDPNNAMVAELNALNGKVMGPSKVMSVKEGETIELSTNYWYTEGPSETPLYNLTEILAGVLLNLGTAGTGIIPSGAESALAALNNVGSPQFGNLHDFLGDAFQDIDLSEPQAYLVYMFFDKPKSRDRERSQFLSTDKINLSRRFENPDSSKVEILSNAEFGTKKT
jgi:hypothetical protein